MDEAQSAPAAGQQVTERLVRGDTFASLAVVQFRYLLAGTAMAQVAGWMEEVARGWLVLQLTGSAFQLGLVGFIRGFSQLVFSPVAGVLADRMDRRHLATVTQMVPAVVALVIAGLVSTDRVAMWHLYALVCVAGIAGAVNMPTRQVLVYDVVGTKHITNAIALNAVVSNLARIVAPSVGGVFIGLMGIASSYYAQALFFIFASLANVMLRPVARADPVRVPVWQGIQQGIDYVRQQPVVARLVLLNAVPNLIIYPYVAMMPIFAEKVLHAGSAGFGLLLTGVGFGSIPGGLIVANMSGSNWKGRAMGVASLLYMGMVALFSLSTLFVLSFAVLVVAGVGWSMMVTLNQTLLQTNVEDAFRGRVLALYTMAGGLTPFGNLAMGVSANHFGVQASVFVFAVIGFVLAGVLGLGSARMRRL